MPSLFEDQNLEVTITPTPTEDPEVNEAFEGLGASNGASYDQGLNAAMSSAIENAKISGVNVGVSIGNGITEATPGAVAAANALVDSVNAALSGLTGGINLGVGGYTAGNLTANINMDGAESWTIYQPHHQQLPGAKRQQNTKSRLSSTSMPRGCFFDTEKGGGAMRFNGIDIRDVHRGISVEKEIPPGMPTRTVETFSGWDGETLAGVTMSRGTYTVRANIACRRPEDGWRVRRCWPPGP